MKKWTKIYQNEEAINHPAFGGQGRKAYTEWFIEAYKSEPMKSRMIEASGEKYYNEVIRIHEERLEKDNYNIGPQSVEEWDALRKKINNS